ncbi:hypothetical protein K0M31_011783 [Melipona bicolor]|uniref:Uncharacterized protein n=1 Tax=Melipona bicolor TaxID=60889 RepID=A0AA40GA74_9HYME|nr:hypothetical protein K0M31_011783 [Melipona bicolor]
MLVYRELRKFSKRDDRPEVIGGKFFFRALGSVGSQKEISTVISEDNASKGRLSRRVGPCSRLISDKLQPRVPIDESDTPSLTIAELHSPRSVSFESEATKKAGLASITNFSHVCPGLEGGTRRAATRNEGRVSPFSEGCQQLSFPYRNVHRVKEQSPRGSEYIRSSALTNARGAQDHEETSQVNPRCSTLHYAPVTPQTECRGYLTDNERWTGASKRDGGDQPAAGRRRLERFCFHQMFILLCLRPGHKEDDRKVRKEEVSVAGGTWEGFEDDKRPVCYLCTAARCSSSPPPPGPSVSSVYNGGPVSWQRFSDETGTSQGVAYADTLTLGGKRKMSLRSDDEKIPPIIEL